MGSVAEDGWPLLLSYGAATVGWMMPGVQAASCCCYSRTCVLIPTDCEFVVPTVCPMPNHDVMPWLIS